MAPTPKLNAKWHQFLSENPERWDVIQDASLIVKAIKVEEPSISDQEIKSLIQHTVNKIEQKKEARTGVLSAGIKPFKIAFFRQTWFRLAASFLLLSGLGWLVYERYQTINLYDKFVTDNKSKLIEVINNGVNPQIVLLNDGSKVTLNAGSRISYEASFSGNNRVVYLTGKPFST